MARTRLGCQNDPRSGQLSSPSGAGHMIRPICGSIGAVMTIAVITAATAQPTKNAPPPVSTPVPNAAPNSDQPNVDVAYGLFQRGFYLTAFNEAAKRAQQNDPAAMTLLGELSAQGLGVA